MSRISWRVQKTHKNLVNIQNSVPPIDPTTTIPLPTTNFRTGFISKVALGRAHYHYHTTTIPLPHANFAWVLYAKLHIKGALPLPYHYHMQIPLPYHYQIPIIHNWELQTLNHYHYHIPIIHNWELQTLNSGPAECAERSAALLAAC